MDAATMLTELESIGKERTKKMYISNGAKEPVYGVATGKMKPFAKQIKKDQELAEELYATGNYDAMYFAGVIADPDVMTADDFERWIDDAYFFMISDYIVAVTLSESAIAQEVADKWIHSEDELRMSAGWSCYCWLLGSQPDNSFDQEKIAGMLEKVKNEIHDTPERTKASMNNFLYTVGISYKLLSEKALEIAQAVGEVVIIREVRKPQTLNAAESIQKDLDKGRLGFKRKYVRC